MDSDDLSDVLDDATPRCPTCMTHLEVEGDGYVLAVLECPTCGGLWL